MASILSFLGDDFALLLIMQKKKKKKLSIVFVALLGAALYLALEPETKSLVPEINIWQEMASINKYYQSGHYQKDLEAGKVKKMDAFERINQSYQTLHLPPISKEQFF